MASLNKLILLLAVFCVVVLLTSSRAIVATNQQTELNDYPGKPETYRTCLPPPSTTCYGGSPAYGRRFGAKGVHNTAAAKTKKDGPKN